MASESRSLFMALVTISQIFGVGSVVLMGIWLGKFQGGFGWGYKNAHKFNYHPLFMTIGLIFIYGDGKLITNIRELNQNGFTNLF